MLINAVEIFCRQNSGFIFKKKSLTSWKRRCRVERSNYGGMYLVSMEGGK